MNKNRLLLCWELLSERNPQMQLNEYKSQNQNLYSVNYQSYFHDFKQSWLLYKHTCVNTKSIVKIDLVADSLDFIKKNISTHKRCTKDFSRISSYTYILYNLKFFFSYSTFWALTSYSEKIIWFSTNKFDWVCLQSRAPTFSDIWLVK